jgi:uncharacterized protein (DUF433 family)
VRRRSKNSKGIDILEYLAGGMTEAEILEDFSELTFEDIKACLCFCCRS